MSYEQLSSPLIELRLRGMAEALEHIHIQPTLNKQSFDEKVFYLLDAERNHKQKKRQERLFRLAKLKQGEAHLEDIDYTTNRGIDSSYLKDLCNCQWLEKNQFMVITGPTGTGKSWLACAFGNEAIRRNLSVLYKRFILLLEELEIARRDGSLPKLRTQLSKVKLLILDDWALTPLNDQGRQDVLDLIEDRLGSAAIIITTQLPISQWHEYIGEPTYADAIMDRIVHRAHKLDLKGESMRKVHSSLDGGRNND
jgi:DNA replication protein DnaC